MRLEAMAEIRSSASGRTDTINLEELEHEVELVGCWRWSSADCAVAQASSQQPHMQPHGDGDGRHSQSACQSK